MARREENATSRVVVVFVCCCFVGLFKQLPSRVYDVFRGWFSWVL